MFTFIKKVIKIGAPTSSCPLEPIVVDGNFHDKPERSPQQYIDYAACVSVCPSSTLVVKTDLVTSELTWQFSLGRYIFYARCKEVCPTAAIKLSQEYELAVQKRDDSLQQLRFGLYNCCVRDCPFMVQKEIDYAIALLRHNGDTRTEDHRENFETCPDCKHQECLAPSGRTELTRHMKEAG